MNTQSSLAVELHDKAYRDAYVASQLRVSLPMQCRALRESREWTQPALAEAAAMSQPRISEIERPGERRLNLDTLLRLASAFDVALQVRFVPFSDFVDDNDTVDLDNYSVPPFEMDMENLANFEKMMQKVECISSRIEQQAQGTKAYPADILAAKAVNSAPMPKDQGAHERMRGDSNAA